MVICLDTNVWIFGILQMNVDCITILANLDRFEVRVPNQVRAELERNLNPDDMQIFYSFLLKHHVHVEFEAIPESLVVDFYAKGLKKGDAVIGAFCELHGVNVLISHNRDFLRGLAPERGFEVVSPQIFCQILE